MKKSNIVTLAVLILAVALVLVFAMKSKDTSSNESFQNETTSISKDENSFQPSATANNPEASLSKETTAQIKDGISMPNTLFIGDSRTVGLMEYSKIKDADFFCNVGMSVFNIYKQRPSVPKISKITLEELLSKKNYDKIYLMLGINELGYNFDSIISQYSNLLSFIEERQPNALIIIQANLHVTKKRSDSDKTINNPSIDKLNRFLENFANSKNIFYIDPNILFDDESGNLSAEKTEDSAHIYAKYYPEWAQWIDEKTKQLV